VLPLATVLSNMINFLIALPVFLRRRGVGRAADALGVALAAVLLVQ